MKSLTVWGCLVKGIDLSPPLKHAGVYDPAKARAYYLRTRVLKGRKKGSGDELGGDTRLGGSPNNVIRPSRQAELREQRDRLEKRLERLKSILSNMVDAAKARSGVEVESKSAKSETSKAAEKKASSKDKPLTEKQKQDKRDASKKQYEEEKGATLSVEVQQLQKQVKEIRAKIEAALEDSRRKAKKKNDTLRPQDNSNLQTAVNGR